MAAAMSRVAQEHATYVADQQQLSPLCQSRQAWAAVESRVPSESQAWAEQGRLFTPAEAATIVGADLGTMGSSLGTSSTMASIDGQGQSQGQEEVAGGLETGWHDEEGQHELGSSSYLAEHNHHTHTEADADADADADAEADRGLPEAYLTIYGKLRAAKAMAPSPQRKQLLQALYNMGSALLKAQAIPMPALVPTAATPSTSSAQQQAQQQGEAEEEQEQDGQDGHERPSDGGGAGGSYVYNNYVVDNHALYSTEEEPITTAAADELYAIMQDYDEPDYPSGSASAVVDPDPAGSLEYSRRPRSDQMPGVTAAMALLDC
jgi:hypothetical protein